VAERGQAESPRPGTLRVFARPIPLPPPLLAAAAVEVPEIPDLADATLISMLDVITVTIIDSRDTCAAMRARSGSSRSLQVDNDDG